MDVQHRLRELEERYRVAAQSAAAAKAHYLALREAPAATSTDLERAKSRWKNCASRLRTVAARMGENEPLCKDCRFD
jgi:hypothetical protein